MQIIHKIVLDLNKPTRTNTIILKKGDSNSVKLQVALHANDRPLDMSTVEQVYWRCATSTGYRDTSIAEILEDEDGNRKNIIEFVVPEAVFAAVGVGSWELEIRTSAPQTYITQTFYTNCENLIYDEEDYLTDEEIELWKDCFARATAAERGAEQVYESLVSLYGLETDPEIYATKEYLDTLIPGASTALNAVTAATEAAYAAAEEAHAAAVATQDSKDNTVTFTSGDTASPVNWASVDVITSGETHASLLRKLSTMVANVRYLEKLIGDTIFGASNIGDGTLTGFAASFYVGTDGRLHYSYTVEE